MGCWSRIGSWVGFKRVVRLISVWDLDAIAETYEHEVVESSAEKTIHGQSYEFAVLFCHEFPSYSLSTSKGVLWQVHSGQVPGRSLFCYTRMRQWQTRFAEDMTHRYGFMAGGIPTTLSHKMMGNARSK